jgi:hypothetical protein
MREVFLIGRSQSGQMAWSLELVHALHSNFSPAVSLGAPSREPLSCFGVASKGPVGPICHGLAELAAIFLPVRSHVPDRVTRNPRWYAGSNVLVVVLALHGKVKFPAS